MRKKTKKVFSRKGYKRIRKDTKGYERIRKNTKEYERIRHTVAFFCFFHLRDLYKEGIQRFVVSLLFPYMKSKYVGFKEGKTRRDKRDICSKKIKNQMKCYKKIESQISIPNGVKIEKKEQLLIFSGILGFTKLDLTKIDPMGLGGIRISEKEKSVFIFAQSKPFFYSLKSLLTNKIRGVTVGFKVSLRIVGVGYRASLQRRDTSTWNHVLNFKLGYSHNLKYQVPDSIRAFLLEPTVICLFGIDKNQVSQVATKIRTFKVPERYKGKGIRFTTENVKISQGKRK